MLPNFEIVKTDLRFLKSIKILTELFIYSQSQNTLQTHYSQYLFIFGSNECQIIPFTSIIMATLLIGIYLVQKFIGSTLVCDM